MQTDIFSLNRQTQSWQINVTWKILSIDGSIFVDETIGDNPSYCRYGPVDDEEQAQTLIQERKRFMQMMVDKRIVTS